MRIGCVGNSFSRESSYLFFFFFFLGNPPFFYDEVGNPWCRPTNLYAGNGAWTSNAGWPIPYRFFPKPE